MNLFSVTFAPCWGVRYHFNAIFIYSAYVSHISLFTLILRFLSSEDNGR
jgi:hypothetical protein